MTRTRFALCLAVQFAGAFAAFWLYFLSTDDPTSWFTRAVRLRG